MNIIERLLNPDSDHEIKNDKDTQILTKKFKVFKQRYCNERDFQKYFGGIGDRYGLGSHQYNKWVEAENNSLDEFIIFIKRLDDENKKIFFQSLE
jgi:hypothetical protein